MEYLPAWMFLTLTILLMGGFPVTFTLLGTAMVFGLIGFGWGFFNLLPLRIWGVIGNVTLLAVPLFVFAVIGLWRQKFFGCVSSWMIFGISLYWTTVAWCKQYFYIQESIKCEPFTAGVHFVLAFVFLFSLWGSGYLYKKRHWFS